MRSRHNNRQTLEINDEYDVQNLFNCQLILHDISDIRRAEDNPSYANLKIKLRSYCIISI